MYEPIKTNFDLTNIGLEDIKNEVQKFDSTEFRKQFLIDPLEELQPPQTAWGLKKYLK